MYLAVVGKMSVFKEYVHLADISAPGRQSMWSYLLD